MSVLTSVLFWFTDFAATYVECFMCCIFCSTFIDRSALSKRKILSAALPAAVALIAILLNSVELFSYFNTFILAAFYILCQWILLRKKKIISVLLVIAYFVILSAVDFSVAFGTGAVSGVDVEIMISEQNFIRFFCTLLSKAVLALIIISVNRLTKKSRPIIRKHTAILFVCSLFLLISNFTLAKLYIDNPSGKISSFAVIYFFASILMVVLLFYFTIKLSDYYEKRQTMNLIEIQNKMLKKSLDDSEQTFNLWRKSIHDYKNNIFALSRLADDGNIKEIREYLNEQNELLSKKMFYLKTGNSTVDAIIYIKQKICERENINFIANISFPTECKISDIDLSSVLGNLIDNAIEASANEEKPEIVIDIKQCKNFLLIKVNNRFTGGEPDFENSSKNASELHGIGIKSVKNIAAKYNGEFTVTSQDNTVSAVFILPD